MRKRLGRFSRLERILVAGNLVNALGDGMFAATSILFFTTVRGFHADSVAGAMALAGGLALGVGIPVGKLADRVGIRGVLVILTALEGSAVLSYAWIHRFWLLGVALCVAVASNRSAPGVRNAYIARAVPGTERVKLRAVLRTVTNIGLAAGGGVAALILAVDDHVGGFEAILMLDAITFWVSAVLYWRAPRQDGLRVLNASLRGVLGDRPFVLAATGEAILSLHTQLLQVGVPLWVATRTRLPHATIPALLALSSLACVLCQVPAARGTANASGASRAARRAGLLLALSCAVYAVAPGHQSWVVGGVLVLATLLRAAGEVTQTASAWGLAFSLAPLESVGLYQSFFSTGYTAALVVGPLLWTATATRHDPLGWLLGILLFITGAELAHGAGCLSRARRDGTAQVDPPMPDRITGGVKAHNPAATTPSQP